METILAVLLAIVLTVLIFMIVIFQRQMTELTKSRSDQTEELKKSQREEIKRLGEESMVRNMTDLKNANAESISALLRPLQMNLNEFNESVRRSHLDAEASRRTLSVQIENLRRMNEAINSETRSLADALRGNNGVLGKWGETVLESILTAGGMVKGLNFDTQVARDTSGRPLEGDEGRGQRPDVIVKLPEERFIIIDAKATLSAYMEYCRASDRKTADDAARRHVDSVKRNVDILAGKQYQKSKGNALGQVLMFIPNDAALILALNTDPSLMEYAMRRNVTLAGPVHLISIVQLVNEIWRSDSKDRNAEKIAETGGMLYDSVCSFMTAMENLDRNIRNARTSYDDALSRLKSTKGVLRRAEKLREMGVRSSRRLNVTVGEPESKDPD